MGGLVWVVKFLPAHPRASRRQPFKPRQEFQAQPALGRFSAAHIGGSGQGWPRTWKATVRKKKTVKEAPEHSGACISDFIPQNCSTSGESSLAWLIATAASGLDLPPHGWSTSFCSPLEAHINIGHPTCCKSSCSSQLFSLGGCWWTSIVAVTHQHSLCL